MACDVEVSHVAIHKKIRIVALRPLCFPLRPVVCIVDYDRAGDFHFAYSGNTDPFHEGFTAAGLRHAMRRPQSSFRTLHEVFRVLNDIPNREALAQFARIQLKVLKRSPSIV